MLINCPYCNMEFSEEEAEISRKQNHLRCPVCHKNILSPRAEAVGIKSGRPVFKYAVFTIIIAGVALAVMLYFFQGRQDASRPLNRVNTSLKPAEQPAGPPEAGPQGRVAEPGRPAGPSRLRRGDRRAQGERGADFASRPREGEGRPAHGALGHRREPAPARPGRQAEGGPARRPLLNRPAAGASSSSPAPRGPGSRASWRGSPSACLSTSRCP